jgi:hypothetical protein
MRAAERYADYWQPLVRSPFTQVVPLGALYTPIPFWVLASPPLLL